MGWLYWTLFVFIVAYFIGVSVGKSNMAKKLIEEMVDYGLIKQEYIGVKIVPEEVISKINMMVTNAEIEKKEAKKELEDGRKEQEAKLAKKRQEQKAIFEQREREIEEVKRENIKNKQQLTNERSELEVAKQEIEDIKYELGIEKEEISVLAYKSSEDTEVQNMYQTMYATGISVEGKVSDEINTEIRLLNVEEVDLIKKLEEGKTPQYKRINKIIIGAYNTEVKYMLKNMKYSNRDKVKQDIIKLYRTYNKKLEGVIMFSASETQYWNTIDKKKGTDDSSRYFVNYTLPKELLELKLKQADLNSAYLLQKEIEDDRRREELKIIREQAQEERELKAELDKLAKEETHYEKQIKKMEQYVVKAPDEVQRLEYQERIKELEQQLVDIQEAKVDVESKTFNNKAGYVYIISNEGSFGKDIIKIGVTRRLEPMERIKELSGAAVPFDYSVNAFIFSDDAFNTEAKLHQQFRGYEVNKVNHQKEFFRVPIELVEDYVKQEIDSTISFNTEINSEQYLETLRLQQQEDLIESQQSK